MAQKLKPASSLPFGVLGRLYVYMCVYINRGEYFTLRCNGLDVERELLGLAIVVLVIVLGACLLTEGQTCVLLLFSAYSETYPALDLTQSWCPSSCGTREQFPDFAPRSSKKGSEKSKRNENFPSLEEFKGDAQTHSDELARHN